MLLESFHLYLGIILLLCLSVHCLVDLLGYKLGGYVICLKIFN